ncbi:MAG: hypothetical protein Q8M92_08490 [Candidatus Subteraquimicrobiales bacterium]|nr:hypothetical protein [Candidatus Subteraquimicrobiales bacterium]
MDRMAIKTHFIRKLKELTGNQYSITGEFPEDVKDIAIVVSIINERQVTGYGTGRISYDFINDTEETLYISIFTIGITVYAPIDEEATNICGALQDIFKSKRHAFISLSPKITNVSDASSVSMPTMREHGTRKTWASQINIELTGSEIIKTELTRG